MTTQPEPKPAYKRIKTPEEIRRYNATPGHAAARERYLAKPEVKARLAAKRRDYYQRRKSSSFLTPGNGRIRMGYIALLRAGGCIMCGAHEVENDENGKQRLDNGEVGPLEFHHLDWTWRKDGGTKDYDVSQMHSMSYAKIDAEVAKCVVLCRRCHRNLHKVLRRAAKLAAKPVS